MLPEGKCRYIDGQIYPDGNFYVLDTQHIKHNGNELKSALNGISTDISNKVDKVAGKGLSTEDYTTAEKNKLSGIETNANNYVHPTTSGNKHIPSGGSAKQILKWWEDGAAIWELPSLTTVFNDAYVASKTVSYTMNKNDFGEVFTGGIYLIAVVNWSVTPEFSLYAVYYSGNVTTYTGITKICGPDISIAATGGVISVTSTGKIQIFALV